MRDLHTHLHQPLSIDTNITYDLDMSKFPGLDDPQQMYQPALLIATDWSDYVHHDAQCVTYDADDATRSYDSDDIYVDDLYFLIESSQEFFTDVSSSNVNDDYVFQSLFDDVVEDNDVVTTIDIDPDTPNIMTHPLEDVWDCVDDGVCFYSEETGKHNCDKVLSTEQLPPFESRIRGQKRRRNDEIENEVAKKSKMADRSSLHIPIMISYCSKSNGFELERHS